MNSRAVAACVAILTVAALHAGSAGATVTVSERSLVSIPGHRTTEFAAAQDPTNPSHLVAAGIDWDTWRGTWTCAAFVSWDAGATWTGGLVMPNDDYAVQGDPWVTFGPDGTVHYSCLSIRTDDPNPVKQLYARSTDGGKTWSTAVAIAPRTPEDHVDRNGLVVAGHTVVSCVNEYEYPPGDPNPYAAPIFDGLAVARSIDDGLTWSPTKQLFTTYAGCRGAAAGPQGDLYISFVGTLPDGSNKVGIVHSADDGITWSAPTWIDNPSGDDLGHVYYGGLVTASQRTGSVFVARPGASPRLYRSIDKGVSYEPITLPDIPTTCTTCTSVNRTLVTSTANGDIGVEVEIGDLNDIRAQVTHPVSLTREEWLLVSRDDGQTWLPPVRVASSDPANSYLDPRAWLPSPGAVAGDVNGINRDPTDAQSNFWSTAGPLQRWDHVVTGGDYIDMTTSGDDFIVMWDAHYNGIPQIWSAKVSIS